MKTPIQGEFCEVVRKYHIAPLYLFHGNPVDDPVSGTSVVNSLTKT